MKLNFNEIFKKDCEKFIINCKYSKIISIFNNEEQIKILKKEWKKELNKLK